MEDDFRPKLSICISTLNRSEFIGLSLDSILEQMPGNCEIVVSDNGSTDETSQVVEKRARRFDGLRYIRHESDCGFDRNIDRVVRLSRGEYCWLFSDDDLMKPDAISTVLNELDQNYSLVLVNMELRDPSMTDVLRRWIYFDADRVYASAESDRLFADLDGTIVNLCNIVIRRSVWLSRDRTRYYGSMFIHTGVLFQKRLPGPALVISEPLIMYRSGNVQSFANKWSEMWLVKWPAVIASLDVAEWAKKSVRTSEPWRCPLWLLTLREGNAYSLTAYRRWLRPQVSSLNWRLLAVVISILPRAVARSTRTLYRYCRARLRLQPITFFTMPQ